MLAIFKRELRSCFHGMIGAVLTAFMLAATAIYFVALNLGYGLPDFGYYTLYRTIFVLLLYIPVLTMRSFAEERHSRTDQLLLTSPVSVGGIVLGKYFALCVIFALPCLVDAGMILVLKALGATGTSTLANFSALLCYYLMGCAAIAIGVFLSSLTENQIIAAPPLTICLYVLLVQIPRQSVLQPFYVDGTDIQGASPYVAIRGRQHVNISKRKRNYEK